MGECRAANLLASPWKPLEMLYTRPLCSRHFHCVRLLMQNEWEGEPKGSFLVAHVDGRGYRHSTHQTRQQSTAVDEVAVTRTIHRSRRRIERGIGQQPAALGRHDYHRRLVHLVARVASACSFRQLVWGTRERIKGRTKQTGPSKSIIWAAIRVLRGIAKLKAGSWETCHKSRVVQKLPSRCQREL